MTMSLWTINWKTKQKVCTKDMSVLNVLKIEYVSKADKILLIKKTNTFINLTIHYLEFYTAGVSRRHGEEMNMLQCQDLIAINRSDQ